MVEPRLLVLGAGGPAAENFIKSLRAAYPDSFVVGADVNPWLLELSTADETVVLRTDPASGAIHFHEVEDLVTEYDITMVHGQPDEEAAFLALWSDKLPVFMPDGSFNGVVASCQDKLTCAQYLGDLAPRSMAYSPFPYEFLANWDNAGLSNDRPLWMRARRGAGSLAAKSVRGFRDISAWRDTWAGKVAPEDFMLSEYLPGRDVSYTGVWFQGAPVAAACRERLEYADTRTPSGQSSSPRVAKICNDEPVFEIAEAAIRKVNEACSATPHGVFYVDMKCDDDGTPKVTEINAGRFNTTQNFYTEAGMNLVATYVGLHHGDVGAVRADPVYGYRLKRHHEDVVWVRQPDMGHKLIIRSKVPT